METFITLVLTAGVIVGWAGVGLTVFRLFQMALRGTFIHALRYAIWSIILAGIVYIPASMLGAWLFCFSSSAGLCGLGGFVGTGPLLAGVCLLVRAKRAVQHSASAP